MPSADPSTEGRGPVPGGTRNLFVEQARNRRATWRRVRIGLVTGAVALLWSAHPDWNYIQVIQKLSYLLDAADYDACAYSVLTPYPGTLTWYEMKKANRIVSYDWEKYGSLNGYASDLLEICAALDLEDVILVGHSVSTMIAVRNE